MELYFAPRSFPRTIGRDEWREIWRWQRVKRKELAEQNARRARLLQLDLPQQIKQSLLDDLINPPLLMHDRQWLR